jgi:diaminopimelate decarboxylase
MAAVAELPRHAAQTQFPLLEDCLQIGGVQLTRLAERVGCTPFYAYERSHIVSRVELLRRTLPPDVHLHYAVKANPMPALVQMMAALVDGFDVASSGEMKVALDAGMAPDRISFAGPGKRDAELRRAVAAGVLLHLESEMEMERAARIGAELGMTPRVAVRVNPDFELKHAGMKWAVARASSASMPRACRRCCGGWSSWGWISTASTCFAVRKTCRRRRSARRSVCPCSSPSAWPSMRMRRCGC